MTREASPLSTALVHILETWAPAHHFNTTVELKRREETLTFVFRPTHCCSCDSSGKDELVKSFSDKLSEVQRRHRSGEMSLMEYLQASSEIWSAAREDDVEIELGVIRGDVVKEIV